MRKLSFILSLIFSLQSGSALQAASLRLLRVASGVISPTDIQSPRDGSGRMFVVQQEGQISIFQGGAFLPAPFLNIDARVSSGGERGLLGLAFPPNYASKQYFYVNYTNNSGDTVIARYRVTADPNVADPNSEQILLTIDQPAANHNGGQLRFSPRDGYLYIGMGDGGASGATAQAPMSLLGKMLRVNVEPDLPQIQIPPDNPFVNNPSYRPEIWALGLRNPFRFSFDRFTGDLWIADVGQNDWEEIDYQPASSTGGENYGWPVMEGLECFQPGCNPQGLTLPVAVYDHSQGCSVTGGFVYRGQAFPGLRGTYLYSDYCSGNIWGIRKVGSQFLNALLFPSGRQITAFGEGEGGELFAADYSSGDIYLVVVIQ